MNAHDRAAELRVLKTLATRWIRARDRRAVAEAQLDVVGNDKSPLYKARESDYDKADRRLVRLEADIIERATRLGAVAPRYVRVDDLIIAVAADAGVLDGEEKIAIIDLRQPADPADVATVSASE